MAQPRRETRVLESFHNPPDPVRIPGLLTVRRAGHLEAAPAYGVRRQALLGHDLLYCVRGAGTVQVDEVKVAVAVGQLAWLPGHRPHGHEAASDDPWTVLWLRLDGNALEPCWRQLLGNRSPVIDVGQGPALTAWFQRLFACLRLRSVDIDLPLNALAAELLVLVEAEVRGALVDRLPAPLARLTAAIAADPRRPWTEGDLQVVARISPSHLRRLFRSHLQMTPRAWLRRERILLAQELLTQSGARVSAVAEACGFCDIYHFSREFRRVVGLSPTQWRHNEGAPSIEVGAHGLGRT